MKLTPWLFHWIVRPRWIANQYVGLIKEHFNPSDERVLDYGCGIGSYCPLFSPKVYWGLDKDPQRIEYAKKKYPGYRFDALTMESDLPMGNGTVDKIMMISVLHHMPSVEIIKMLAEFQRVLKPQGKLVFIEPCLSKKIGIRDRLMKRLDEGKYIRTPDEYLHLLSSNGYDAVLGRIFRKLWLYQEMSFVAFQR